LEWGEKNEIERILGRGGSLQAVAFVREKRMTIYDIDVFETQSAGNVV